MVEYCLEGPAEAPVLVLSNSLGTTWAMWDAQVATLSRYFRVLRYNTRGHGASALPGQPMDLSRLGQDVVDLLDHLAIGQACFCGISLGGLTGMWLNRYAGSRFQAIAVANTAARIGNETGWQQRAALVREKGMSPIVEGSAPRWFTPAFCQQSPDKVQTLLDGLAVLDPEGYACCCDVLAQADLREQAPQMLRPMLVIAGEQDPVTTCEDARWLVQQAPQAQPAYLPASHLSNIERPEAFSQLLLSFFSEQDVIHAEH